MFDERRETRDAITFSLHQTLNKKAEAEASVFLCLKIKSWARLFAVILLPVKYFI